MDITQLLDKDVKRKYKLLIKIASLNGLLFSQNKLEQYLNVTRNTLLRIIDEIQLDIKHLGYEQYMILNFDSVNKSYSLTLSSSFSIDIIKVHYFKNSIRFKLIEELFYDEPESISIISERHYVSEITLRRLIKELNDFLKEWGIFLTTRSKMCLVGDEALIQSFYVYLFFNIYGGISWPFKNFEELEISNYTAFCLSNTFKIESSENNILMSYIISVSIERSRNKHVYLKSDKYLYFDNDKYYETSIKKAALILSKYLPKKSSEQLEVEFRLHCSLLLVNDVLDCVPRLPNFFFLKSLKDHHLIPTSMFLISIVEMHLDKSLNPEQYSTLLNKICISHYSAFFLYDAITIIPKNWVINKKYNSVSKHPFFKKAQDNYLQVTQIEEFYELSFFNHFLQIRDIGILFNLISDEFYKKKIKIYIKTIHDSFLKKVILNNFNNFFEISFCNFDNCDVCIVTNERDMISNSINNKNFKIFLWNPISEVNITLERFKLFLSKLEN